MRLVRSLIIKLSISNSFATRNPLAPIPDNPSKKIFDPESFLNAAYAIMEKSHSILLLDWNAGSFGGTFCN